MRRRNSTGSLISPIGRNPLGITAAKPEIDLSQTIAWKDGIVGRLNSGVSGLLKRAKVKMVQGRARSATARRSRSRRKPAARSSVPRTW